MAKRPTDQLRALATQSFHNLTVIRETFDWWWVLVGVGFLVAANLLAYLALRGVIEEIVRQQRVLTAAALMAVGALVIYFLGGLLVGRLSKGHTVKEPAVAAVLALVVLFLLQLAAGMVNIVGLVLGAPLCFGVTYLGGILGEKWQDRSRRG
jgi:hypothetical protein